MRTESEMYDLILGTARENPGIKAVYMNGSRTNKNAPRDMFQDYDIVYVVEDLAAFTCDNSWIGRFGEILYMQMPDAMQLPGDEPDDPDRRGNTFAYLMQFADGTRIDLTLQTAAYALAHIRDDRLCTILLDKEHILPETGEATDCQHWVKRPAEEQYLAVCNEFWWCTNNIAKGLWREEMPYVQDMTNNHVRPQLVTMLNWKAGLLNDWSVSTGKSSKYLYRWLPREEWQQFLSTYFDGNTENAWQSVMRMCRLFDSTARYVGGKMGWQYREQEGKGAMAFLEYVRKLPRKENGV